MKVSVITVVLNAADVIGPTLESVVAQTHPDIEQIIVDGGSTDGTMDAVSRYAAKGAVVVSESDGGIYDAMNKGLRLATGDAVIFINADDVLAQPAAIAYLAASLDSGPDLGFVFGDVLVRSEESDQYTSHANKNRGNIGFPTICHQAILARTKLFSRIGVFETRYRVCADLDWLLRCVDENVLFAHVPRVICWYRSGGESDRLVERRRIEWGKIIGARRTRLQRSVQRVAGAVRRRIRGLWQ